MTDILWRFSHLLHGHPKDFPCFLAKTNKQTKKKNAKRVFLLKLLWVSVIVSFIISNQNPCKISSSYSLNCNCHYSCIEDNIKKASFTIDLPS